MNDEVLSKYWCPRCGHEWTSLWDSSCDDECPKCELRNISPFFSIETSTIWELVKEKGCVQ